MRFRSAAAAVLALFVSLAVIAGAIVLGSSLRGPVHRTVVVHRSSAPTETIYIKNHAPRYFPDRAIRHDIPAWEQAANKDFAPLWRVPHVRIVLIQHRSVPAGGILATFKEKGPVSGALAFHGVFSKQPYITIYSGVTKYYGWSPSVAFTHELFELMADHFVSGFNIGYPTANYYVGSTPYQMPRYAPWFNEVCDPVEAFHYRIRGVAISDFVTRNWFNDAIGAGGFDYQGLVQFPFQVLRGGYAQFVTDGHDNVVQDFRHSVPDASGFLKGEGRFGD